MTTALTSPAPRKARGCCKRPKLTYGVGTNDADYRVHISAKVNGKSVTLWFCPFYTAWHGVLERCYSKKFHTKRPTYIGCSVAKEWHTFSTFRAWMIAQPWEGNQLDKDLLFPGNKVYGPDTCVFVSGLVNNFVIARGAERGLYPIGVCWDKRKRVFRAQCCNPFTGDRGFVGGFSTAEEAHEAWRARKHQYACTYADQQTDRRVADALRSRYAPA